MNELFGVPLSTFMVVLVGLLGIALLSVAWVAIRRPVIFKLGVRNIPRRKAQTILTVAGLMLSTLIISAAFGTGDTLDHSLTSDVYGNLGHVDELVVSSPSVDAEGAETGAPIPASALTLVEQGLSGNGDIDGIMPILDLHVPATAEASRQSEPEVVLTGLDPSRLEAFGDLEATNGDAIDLTALPENSVVLSELGAKTLGVTTGDTVRIFYQNQPYNLTVAAIAGDSYLTGVRRDMADDAELPGMVMALDTLQALTGQADTLTSIAISNAGGVRDSLEPTDAVVGAVQPVLEGQGLGVNPIKDDRVGFATDSAQVFTGLFLVFGLFSIAAGILLIILIFSMLAAERRAEMGMERAVGAQRRQLVQQFISEGTIYALLAGLVGVTLGVLAAAGIARGIQPLIGETTTIEWSTSATSVIVSYCLGVGITFLSVVVSSWRISRLNIVSAIRDIPDVTTLHRKARSLIGAVVLLVGGAGLLLLGISSESAFPFRLGLSLLPFGVALALRYAGVSSRLVFSLVAIYLLTIWLLPTATFNAIFGEYDGEFEMFFLSGIFLVLASTMLVVQNTALLLKGVGALGGLLKGKIASFRTAIAYPGASPVRTGMTIAMFCLIVFALVMTATMSENFRKIFLSDDANAGWDIRADTQAANPVDDLMATLQSQGVDTSQFAAVGVTTSPNSGFSQVRVSGTEEWESFDVAGMDGSFLDETDLLFQQYAAGYGSDEAILNALRNEPGVAVVTANALPQDGPPVGGVSDFQIEGMTADTEGFEPIAVELAVPGTNEVRDVRIIGIIDSTITGLSGLFMNQATYDATFPSVAATSSYIALDGGDAEAAAQEIEGALLPYGVQAISIRDTLEEDQSSAASFFYIVQGFMGLGLFVGIAAIGVIAFRSVVERRQQIGVLRAIGYQRGEVALSFLIETAFIVTVGVITGTALGLVLARNLFTGDELGETAETFVIPWDVVSIVLIATVAVALLMTWVPARQASKIAPAEALRYE